MKVRNGFVSNSSSSSFVIPIDKNKKMTIEISIEDFRRMLGSSDDSEVSEVLTNEDDVKRSLLSRYGYGYGYKSFEDMVKDDDWILEKFNELMEYINADKSVMFGSIGYGETLASSIIEKCGGKVND